MKTEPTSRGDIRKLSGSFSSGDELSESPYTLYILPMAQQNPSVRCVVAALALSHMEDKADDQGFNNQSLWLRIEAPQLLREQLKNSEEGSDIGSLACIVLLVQIPVADFLQRLDLTLSNFLRCAQVTVQNINSIQKQRGIRPGTRALTFMVGHSSSNS